jgi:hypothetical protein
MLRCRLRRCSATWAVALGALSACTSTQYHYVAHPDYGDAQHKADLAQCRRENSTVTTIQGYDVQEKVTVDEAKAGSCMTTRGWQNVSR